jgi:hypothetical protein
MSRVSAVAAILTILMCTGCTRLYNVTFRNTLEVRVVLEISQYHAKGRGGTRPEEFTADILESTQQLVLGPGEETVLEFHDAGGGFWLRWRQVEPPLQTNTVHTLELLRDKLEVTIQ